MKTYRLQLSSTMFPSAVEGRSIPVGKSILDGLKQLGSFASMGKYFEVSLQGEPLVSEHWGRVYPKPGALVSVGIQPGNDASTLRTLAMLASVFGGSMLGGKLGGGIITTALQAAGIWAATTLIPIPPPDKAESPTASGLRNDLRQWGKVPRVYGRLRIFPPACAEPVLDVIGNDLYSRVIFVLGQRPLYLEWDSIKIGETPINRFDGVQFDIHDGYFGQSTGQFALYSRDTHMETLNKELRWAKQWIQSSTGVPMPGGSAGGSGPGVAVLNRNVVQLVTAENCVEFSLDLTFPDGLGYQRTDSEFDGYNVDLAVRYRPLGASGSWTNVTAAAVDSQTYINAELHPLTNTELFAKLSQINDALDDAITTLTAIGLGERLITETLFYFAEQQTGRIQETLYGAINTDTALTPDQLDLIEATQTKLDDLGVILQSATRTTEAFTDDLVNFNSIISDVLGAMTLIDGLLAMHEYFRRGYGPDTIGTETFQFFAENPLTGWIVQFLFGKWNYPQIFGEPPTGTFRIINADRAKGAIRKKVTVTGLSPGTYEVQVRRSSEPVWDTNQVLSATNADPAYSSQYHEKVELTAFVSIQAGVPISERAHRRHAMMAVKIRLSNQSGTIDNLNMVVQSPLPWYKPGDGWQPASLLDDESRPVYKNPAWIACDIIRGTGNKRPASDEYVDAERFAEWADYCFENNLFFSGVFDQKSTIQRALEDVCRVGKASPSIRYGKYSVVYDHVQENAVDVVTPRVSANTKVTRIYGQMPHALRIPFVNPDKGWADDEWIVYDDTHGPVVGKNIIALIRPSEGNKIVVPCLLNTVESLVELRYGSQIPFGLFRLEFPSEYPNTTWILRSELGGAPTDEEWPAGDYSILVSLAVTEAERFDTVSIKGLVDSHDQTSENHTGQVYALGRYLLKCAALRPETIQTDMDFTRLKFQRGDRVDVQSDVTLWGLGSGRLVQDPTRDGDGYITSLALDEAFLMADGKSYQIKLRSSTDQFYVADVVYNAGVNYTVALQRPLDAPDIAADDFALWGEKERITVPCIVKGIEAQSDLGARLTFVEHAPAVHGAADEPIPPFDSQITIPPVIALARPPMPEVTGIATDESVLVRQADGTFQSRIRVGFRVPEGRTDAERAISQKVEYIEAQFRMNFSMPYGDGLVVVYAPDAQRTWAPGGYFPKESSAAFLAPVQDGQRYDVRIRCVTRAGVPGEWNLTEGITVLGKTSPPPDVTVVRIDGDELRWEYPAPPIDLAGFRVRQMRGQGGSWELAAPAHEGLLSSSTMSIAPFHGGPREFYVKAVDTSGNESLVAGKAVLEGGGTPVGDEIERYSHRDNAWPGDRTSMEESSGDLVSSAGSMSGFYAGPGAPYYRGPDSDYYTTAYPYVAYEFDHVVDDGSLPYFLAIDLACTGELWQLEVKKVDAPFWPSSDDVLDGAPLFPAQGDQPIWPDLEYHAYRGRIEAEAGTTYRFRVSALGSNTQLVMTQLDVVTTPVSRMAS